MKRNTSWTPIAAMTVVAVFPIESADANEESEETEDVFPLSEIAVSAKRVEAPPTLLALCVTYSGVQRKAEFYWM